MDPKQLDQLNRQLAEAAKLGLPVVCPSVPLTGDLAVDYSVEKCDERLQSALSRVALSCNPMWQDEEEDSLTQISRKLVEQTLSLRETPVDDPALEALRKDLRQSKELAAPNNEKNKAVCEQTTGHDVGAGGDSNRGIEGFSRQKWNDTYLEVWPPAPSSSWIDLNSKPKPTTLTTNEPQVAIEKPKAEDKRMSKSSMTPTPPPPPPPPSISTPAVSSSSNSALETANASAPAVKKATKKKRVKWTRVM